MMRALLERLSRGRILRRQMPERYGSRPIYVTPDSRLAFWRRDLEDVDPELLCRADELVTSGDVVWDIGANVGMFSLAASVLAGPDGQIVAVEADCWLVGLLRRTAREQTHGRAPIVVLPAAVAAQLGVAEFSVAGRGRASNSLRGWGSSQQGVVRESQHVISITLDWMIDHCPSPQVVKIDVEGAEAAVLGGAERLLRGVRPVLICEVYSGNVSMLSNLLILHRYLFRSDTVGSYVKQCVCGDNIVAFPEEKIALIAGNSRSPC